MTFKLLEVENQKDDQSFDLQELPHVYLPEMFGLLFDMQQLILGAQICIALYRIDIWWLSSQHTYESA